MVVRTNSTADAPQGEHDATVTSGTPDATETSAPAGSTAGVTPAVAPSGSGYRAVLKRDDQIVWSCPHVHFTEHSARNCPALQLAAQVE